MLSVCFIQLIYLSVMTTPATARMVGEGVMRVLRIPVTNYVLRCVVTCKKNNPYLCKLLSTLKI